MDLPIINSIQRRRFFLADPFHLSVMQNFTLIMMVLQHHKDSAADCCQDCLDHARHAKEGEKKCNIWVYCPSEFGCHSPDIYQHKHKECWLKYVSFNMIHQFASFLCISIIAFDISESRLRNLN
jgi:hypothetical protein